MLFWAPFLLIVSRFCSDFEEFVKVFSDFTQISSDFAQIFTKSKLLEVRLHFHLLHQCSTATNFMMQHGI